MTAHFTPAGKRPDQPLPEGKYFLWRPVRIQLSRQQSLRQVISWPHSWTDQSSSDLSFGSFDWPLAINWKDAVRRTKRGNVHAILQDDDGKWKGNLFCDVNHGCISSVTLPLKCMQEITPIKLHYLSVPVKIWSRGKQRIDPCQMYEAVRVLSSKYFV